MFVRASVLRVPVPSGRWFRREILPLTLQSNQTKYNRSKPSRRDRLARLREAESWHLAHHHRAVDQLIEAWQKTDYQVKPNSPEAASWRLASRWNWLKAQECRQAMSGG